MDWSICYDQIRFTCYKKYEVKGRFHSIDDAIMWVKCPYL